MGNEELVSLLSVELPLLHEQYKAGEKRVGLVIVDEVNGFATVGAGNSVSVILLECLHFPKHALENLDCSSVDCHRRGQSFSFLL